jgi:hypothetical protein
VSDEVEAEEEGRVRERRRRDDRLSGDVDAREAERGQRSDNDQVEQLAVPEAQRLPPADRPEHERDDGDRDQDQQQCEEEA